MSSSNQLQGAAASRPPDLPGFVWDTERKRYFRIPPSHAHASLASASAPSSVLTAATAPRHRPSSGHGGQGRGRGRGLGRSYHQHANTGHWQEQPSAHRRKKQRTREPSPIDEHLGGIHLHDGRHAPTVSQLLRLRQFASHVDQARAILAAHRSVIRSSSHFLTKKQSAGDMAAVPPTFESLSLASTGNWQLGLAEPAVAHVPVYPSLVTDEYRRVSLDDVSAGVLISTLSDGSLSIRSTLSSDTTTSLHITSTAGRGIPNSLHYNPTSHSLLLSTLPTLYSPLAELQYLPLPSAFPSSFSQTISHFLLANPTILRCPRDRTIHATHSSASVIAAGGTKCVLVWDAATLQPLNATKNCPSHPHPISLRSDAFAVHCSQGGQPNVLLAGQRDGWLSVIDLRATHSRSVASHPPPKEIASPPKHVRDHRPTHLPTWPVSNILTDGLGCTYAVFRGGHVAEYVSGYGQRMVHVAEEALEGRFDLAMRQVAAGVDPVGEGVVCAQPATWTEASPSGRWMYVLGGKKVAEVAGDGAVGGGRIPSAMVVVESARTGKPLVVSVST